MAFIDELKQLSERIETVNNNIKTEEATKMSLIVPFFQILGYDVFNSSEFCPEFAEDVGINKKEKVDYAILQAGSPVILIECKWIGEKLDKHSAQLFKYFAATAAKFGILTNGIIYKFYTDFTATNKMDLIPFLEINMLDLKETHIEELKKFCKIGFDKNAILDSASELRYIGMITDVLKREWECPSEDFLKFILDSQIDDKKIYDGKKNQKVIDKFQNIIKKSFQSFISELVNDKIRTALQPKPTPPPPPEVNPTPPESKIITTPEEMECFYIVKGILVGTVEKIEHVTYRDTESYFGVLFQDNNRKPICRINCDVNPNWILIPDKNKKFTRYYLKDLNDIYTYKDLLIEVVKHYTEPRENEVAT